MNSMFATRKQQSLGLLAAGLLGGLSLIVVPVFVSASALNILTERSLLLSSSAPGNQYSDGSGGTTYAPPGSGPNGKQTAETFSFRVSTDSSASGTNQALKGFSFQYCTTAAGLCTAPGDSNADLEVHYTAPVEGTDFEVYTGGGPGVGAASSGWAMTTSNEEDGTSPTGKNNLITLTNSSSTLKPSAGTQIVVVFKASSANYITNPGPGTFFAKITDYSSASDVDPLTSASVVDKGVTVGSIVSDSIQIQTKVLETMSFSVGTVNPDTQAVTHGGCDPITANSAINLGDPAADYSLSPSHAYDGFSYWRLATNAANGAAVYYSGVTLSDIHGNQIDPIYDLSGGHTSGDGSMGYSHTGIEQFGLGLDSDADALDAGFVSDVSANPAIYQNPHLSPLVAAANYGAANGAISTNDAGARFAFTPGSLTTPEPIASENTGVVHCSTGKMRYVANVATDTPAGEYATKINYIAAPEY